jgi:large subunit ribosomal protein L4
MTKVAEKKNTRVAKKPTKASKSESKSSESLKVKTYDSLGKEKSEISLPERIFGLPWNADLVHQVMVSAMGNRRTQTAHSKDRSEVAGGGKKPWRQKGTGRARHGSIRSPIWRGGGVTFGPRNEKDYSRKINKKMKIKALFTVLSKKTKQGEVFFIDELKLKEAKTKEAKNTLSGVSKIEGLETLISKKKNSAYIFMTGVSTDIKRSFKNFGNVEVGETKNINILDVLNTKNIIFVSPKESIEVLESKIK